VKISDLEKMVSLTQKKMSSFIACHPDLLVTSSEKKQGIDLLQASIWSLTQD
jgi:GTP-binding protein